MSDTPAIAATILPPSIGFMVANRCSLLLECDPCRALKVLDLDVVARAFGAAARIDDCPLACPTCGAFGTAWVSGPGNATVGRPHYWPPSAWHTLTPSE